MSSLFIEEILRTTSDDLQFVDSNNHSGKMNTDKIDITTVLAGLGIAAAAAAAAYTVSFES